MFFKSSGNTQKFFLFTTMRKKKNGIITLGKDETLRLCYSPFTYRKLDILK